MIKLCDRELCSGCKACEQICPKKCIVMKEDFMGFEYPIINYEKCIKCGKCIQVCPILTPAVLENIPQIYAVYNKNLNIREKSSSGGIFYCLAKSIIDKGGIVFGAAYKEIYTIEHIGVESESKIEKLMGSKYVQSDMRYCYQTMEENLKKDRYVMFSGTPCQSAAVKNYFKNKKLDTSKLILVDLICHGVPSPKIWREYCKMMEKKFDSRIDKVSFRDKTKSWEEFSFRLDFQNGKKILESAGKNIYMSGFLSNLYLRNSCYQCSFKGVQSTADVTMADFWGLDNILPDFPNDHRGISMVMINSDTGRALFASCSNDIYMEEILDIQKAARENLAMIDSVQRNKFSEKFKKIYKEEGLNKAFRVYKYNNFPKKIYYKLRWVCGKTKRIILRQTRQ